MNKLSQMIAASALVMGQSDWEAPSMGHRGTKPAKKKKVDHRKGVKAARKQNRSSKK